MKSDAATVEEYILGLSEERREAVSTVREMGLRTTSRSRLTGSLYRNLPAKIRNSVLIGPLFLPRIHAVS